MNDVRTEVVAARAVGVGIGLIALMMTWLIGNRLAAIAWDPPVGPSVAFVAAIAVGLLTALAAGGRLARRVRKAPSRTDV